MTPPPAGATVTSLDYFEWQAQHEPDVLLARVTGELKGADLANAAMAAGEGISDSARVVPVLLPLLAHERGFVREATAYGLQPHLDYPGVLSALTAARDAEQWASVRAGFDEVLDSVS